MIKFGALGTYHFQSLKELSVHTSGRFLRHFLPFAHLSQGASTLFKNEKERERREGEREGERERERETRERDEKKRRKRKRREEKERKEKRVCNMSKSLT